VFLGLSLVNLGALVCWEGLTSHGLANRSLRAHPLGVYFHNGDNFSLLITPFMGGSFLGLVFGTRFR
jgi:hypothetical protein